MDRVYKVHHPHARAHAHVVAPGHSPISSPLRSSPLANPPIYGSPRTPSTSEARAIPRRTSQPTRSRASIAPIAPLAFGSPNDSHSSAMPMPVPTPSPPPLSRSHPLLGSYSLSLIHSRMSHAHQPHSSSSTFSIHIKAVGQGKRCPPELRCPKPLDLPFAATYYDLEDPGIPGRCGANQTPWVGNVDLEQYYYDQYAPVSTTHTHAHTHAHTSQTVVGMMDPPDHPGYPVAPVGQLQMVIKTPSNALKAFLVPYDLRALAVGGRLLARERTYGHRTSPSNPSSPNPNPHSSSPGTTTSSGDQKTSLRYAYQLQFVCLPVPSSSSSRSQSHSTSTNASARARDSSTNRNTSTSATTSTNTSQSSGGDREPEKAYYLSKTIKVIFTANPPEFNESLRTERTDEIVPASTGIKVSGDGVKQRRRSSVFGTSSPGRTMEDWELVRLKWLARRDMTEIHHSGTTTSVRDSASVPQQHHSGGSTSTSTFPNQDLGSGRTRSGSPEAGRQIESAPTPTAFLPPLKPPVRALTPTPVPQPFNLPNATPMAKPPQSPRFIRRQLRRTSVEERELSEKLRKMGME